MKGFLFITALVLAVILAACDGRNNNKQQANQVEQVNETASPLTLGDTVIVDKVNITDSIVHNGRTVKADGFSIVDVEMRISHPGFEGLSEESGLELFANIVLKTIYIEAELDDEVIYVVGGYGDDTNKDKMFTDYSRTLLIKNDKRYTLINVRYVFFVPKESKNIYLKVFDKGEFNFSGESTGSKYEPDDVWFEQKLN